MQNQTEMGKVIMTNRIDRTVRSHSQMPRPGDVTPGEKSDTPLLGRDRSQNTDGLDKSLHSSASALFYA